MKHISFTLLFSSIFSIIAIGQKSEINFSDPFQIDSSEYFLIPKFVDNDNHQEYGKGKGYFLWGNYSDIVFYDSRTNVSKKLFSGQLALIAPFLTRRNSANEKEPELPANILPNHIVYLARTENYNGDNALDSDDPVYLYISTKKGENLRQITPKGLNVLSWSLSKNKRMILVKAQNDKNKNKKFGNGDDELYYRIDLSDDFLKIECYLINI